MWHSILEFFGIVGEAGKGYAFWSGFGSVILPPVFTLSGIAALYWWHHTCHAEGCYKIGRHPVDGTPFVTCKRHHPHGGNSAAHIADRAGLAR